MVTSTEYSFQFGIAGDSLDNVRITDCSNNVIHMFDSSRKIRDRGDWQDVGNSGDRGDGDIDRV